MESGLPFCTECGTAAPRAPEPEPRLAPSRLGDTLAAGVPVLPPSDDFAGEAVIPSLPQRSRKLPVTIIGIGILTISLVALLIASRLFSNRPPVIGGIDASQLFVRAGDSVTLTAHAIDPNDDALTYKWIASAGQIAGTGSTVTLSTIGATPGSGPTDIRVRVTVSDGRVETTSADKTISVYPPTIATEEPTTNPEPKSSPQTTPTADNNADSTLNANSSRLKTQATLRFSSSIDGAALSIDGVSRGTVSISRAKVLRLSAGQHTVVAQKAGYRPWSRSISLGGGVTETLSIQMEPVGPTPDEIASQYLQRATRLLQQGNYDAAIAACDEGLRLAAGNRLLLQERGEIERARQKRLASLRDEEERRRKNEADEARARAAAAAVERFQPAVVKTRAKTEYPALARTARISGKVVVEVSINEQGGVASAKAIEGPLALHQAALNAARQWKFEPARRGSRTVPDTLKITFNFTL